MAHPYKPLIPETMVDLMDLLAMMMLKSPTFEDKTGYFPHRSIDTIFFQLNEGLKVLHKKLGEERYLALTEMSNRMRVLFEADPEDKTGETAEGHRIILEMMEMLKKRPTKAG